MRMLLVVVGILLFCMQRAAAHGGGGFRDPGSVPPGLRGDGPPPPPPVTCDCARPECAACSDSRLVAATPLRLPGACSVQTTVERWDDFEFVTLEFTFQRTGSTVPLETHLTFDTGPLFAATGGRISIAGNALTAALAPAADARRSYLRARTRDLDPLLVLRLGAGRHRLRAFPVARDGATIVTVEGIRLAAPRKRTGTRLYRTGDRLLAVKSGGPGDEGFHDTAHGRVLRFLDLDAARAEFGEALANAVEVTWVPAVECAVTGRGSAAASDDTALVALPPAERAPAREVVE